MEIFSLFAALAGGGSVPTTIPNLNPWQVAIALFAFLSPNILAIIQQPHWTTATRITMFAVFHAVVAALFLGANDKLNTVNWVGTFVQLVTYAAASYLGIWKPFADKIEVKTSNALRNLTGKGNEPVRMSAASNASPYANGSPKPYKAMDNMYV